MDLDPFVFSNWWHRDFPTPFPKKKWFPNDTFDQQFTYRSTHSLHLRSEKPLPPVSSYDFEPLFKCYFSGYFHRRRHLHEIRDSRI